MKYFVYILFSKSDGKRYIGMTSNLERRLFEHNAGLVKSTRYRRPLEIIHIEEFDNKHDALRRENELKSKKGNLFFL